MKLLDLSPLKAVPGEPLAHMFGVFGMPATGETRAKEWKRVRPLALSVLVGLLFFCVYVCGYVFMYCMCAFMWVSVMNSCSALLPAGPGNSQLLQPHHYWAFGLVNSQHIAGVSKR